MTSLEDERLKKRHTNKNHYRSCKKNNTVTLWNILRDTKKPHVTFILLYIEVALTHSVTRHDFM